MLQKKDTPEVLTYATGGGKIALPHREAVRSREVIV